jgi:DNA polymerase-1
LLARVRKAAPSAHSSMSPIQPSAPVRSDKKAVGGQNYVCIQDEAALLAWITKAQAARIIAIDTETTSLDATQAELVGFSLSTGEGEACYIPVGHGAKGDLLATPPQQIPRERVLALLAPLLQDPAVLKVGHNLKYDLVVLAKYGTVITPTEDTMLISYLLDGGLHRHGMDALAALHLEHETIPFSEVMAGLGKGATFADVPLDKATAYAAEDADVTLQLYHHLKPRLIAERKIALYERVERPLVAVIAAMEARGVKVDGGVLQGLSSDFGARMQVLEAQAFAEAGREFNLASPKQLGEVLFEDLSLPGGKKTKTGAYNTGADVLEELAASGHALPVTLLAWRQLAKLKSTYTEALQKQINPRTGRVHTSFSLAATSTGRLSSNDPNLQNIPIRTEDGRKIRTAFVAEAGNVLLSADYSQIELRLLAHMADIPSLKQAFAEGKDIHRITASQVFGIPLEQVDGEARRRAKAVNFGIIYGMSAFGLAANLGIARGEASSIIDAYFAQYPGIRQFMERTKAQARAQGFVETLFGRRCYLPGIADKNGAVRAFAERAAINAPLQGTAADIIKKAMIACHHRLQDVGLPQSLLLQVHDELLLEVPAHRAEEIAALVQKTMQGVARLSVPLTVEVGQGSNWGQAH